MPRRVSSAKALKERDPIAQPNPLGSLANNAPSPGRVEQGELPEGWSEKTIGKLAESTVLRVRNGYADGGYNQSGEGIPHLRPFNISDSGEIDLSQIKSVQPPPPDSPYRLRHGDVVFNNTNSEHLVGKTTIFTLPGDFVLSNHMTILRVLDPGEIDSEWLARALHYKWLNGECRALCRRHVNQASIGLDRLRSIALALPSFSEQRAIAEVLRTLQRAKGRRRRSSPPRVSSKPAC